MPTTPASPAKSAAAAWTWGIWLLQTGHQGAQNQITAGLPARLAPSKGDPSTWVPVKSSTAGTVADAAGEDVDGRGRVTRRPEVPGARRGRRVAWRSTARPGSGARVARG